MAHRTPARRTGKSYEQRRRAGACELNVPEGDVGRQASLFNRYHYLSGFGFPSEELLDRELQRVELAFAEQGVPDLSRNRRQRRDCSTFWWHVPTILVVQLDPHGCRRRQCCWEGKPLE